MLHHGLDLNCAANGEDSGHSPAASAKLNMNMNNAPGPCILWDATGTGLAENPPLLQNCVPDFN